MRVLDWLRSKLPGSQKPAISELVQEVEAVRDMRQQRSANADGTVQRIRARMAVLESQARLHRLDFDG